MEVTRGGHQGRSGDLNGSEVTPPDPRLCLEKHLPLQTLLDEDTGGGYGHRDSHQVHVLRAVNPIRRVKQSLFPLALLLILLGLVAVPIVVLLVASLRPAGQLPFTGTAWTTATYAEVFGDTSTYHLLKNTFLYAAGSLTVALPLAFVLAWLTERTDLPGRRLLYT